MVKLQKCDIFLEDNICFLNKINQHMSDPQIYVRGFPRNCRESDLKQLFSKYGSIKEVRLIRDYAFIVFSDKEEVENALKMDGEKYQDARLRVQIAGKPRKSKGPQPNDECRYCRRLGHWQNNCPQYRDRRDRRRRRSYSSSSSSSESDRSRSRRKNKKIKKSSRKRSYSSSSSSSSESSFSRSSSGERQNNRRDKSKEDAEK